MMKFPYISIVIVFSITIIAGILHGRMTGRWGAGNGVRQAGNLIEQLPEKIGPWELGGNRSMGDEAERQLQCHGYVHGTYTNVDNGQRVNIAFLLGPPGPIAVHTPEICFSTRSYNQTGSRKTASVITADDEKNQFWSLDFKSKGIDNPDVRVYYAWNGGEGWKASESPRWEYAGAPYLYKLQIVCPVNTGRSGNQDPCEQFLKDFLPVAENHIKFVNADKSK